MTCMFWMSSLVVVGLNPVTGVMRWVTASTVIWGTLSAVKPMSRSTRSPTLMRVPTPVLWSTVTAIARRPGSSRPATSAPPPAPLLNIVGLIWAPALTSVRTVLPTTAPMSP